MSISATIVCTSACFDSEKARFSTTVLLPQSAPGEVIASRFQPLARICWSTFVRSMSKAMAPGAVSPLVAKVTIRWRAICRAGGAKVASGRQASARSGAAASAGAGASGTTGAGSAMAAGGTTGAAAGAGAGARDAGCGAATGRGAAPCWAAASRAARALAIAA